MNNWKRAIAPGGILVIVGGIMQLVIMLIPSTGNAGSSADISLSMLVMAAILTVVIGFIISAFRLHGHWKLLPVLLLAIYVVSMAAIWVVAEDNANRWHLQEQQSRNSSKPVK